MKKFLPLSLLFTVFILEGCDPAATFDRPQPDGVKSLTYFPELLQGDYLSVKEESVVKITDTLITRHYAFDIKEHKKSLDSSYKLVDDTLIYLTDGTKEKIVLEGDSIIRHENWTDTLFKFSNDNICKKFKGYYFLNNRYNDSAWAVKMLSLKRGVLTVGDISVKEDIQKLKEITETTDDTTSTHFTLTKRQFKKFINKDGFGKQEIFKRVTKTAEPRVLATLTAE